MQQCQAVPPPQPGCGRVLVVDDDPLQRESCSEGLAILGHAVETAADGAEAVARLREVYFDVIFSDVSMPRMGGVEFLRNVREVDLDVPVVLMTSGPAVQSAIRAVEYGAFRFLLKPVEIQLMEEVATRAIQLHRLARLKRQALELLGCDQFLNDRASLDARFARVIETLQLAYQPIVHVGRRSVFGYEALARVDEPTLARPTTLFEAAWRLGRVHELGRAVRRLAATAVRDLPQASLLFLNLHAEELSDEELYSASAALSSVASRVVLEITERAQLSGVDDLEARAEALRRLGYRIGIDDLGAGCAGLASVARLAPEYVKIDMPLVRDIHAQPTKRQVVAAMASLSRALGMVVIAEGVEAQEECDALRALGCELQQGFAFGHPGSGFVKPEL
ncbi:MAG: EAL domain-containing protein [Deltaproteobacteria bacterium]|nr:EAL domain-containing protein [Deltaproteobacteria bacterium]